jgi:hypothetical protein
LSISSETASVFDAHERQELGVRPKDLNVGHAPRVEGRLDFIHRTNREGDALSVVFIAASTTTLEFVDGPTLRAIASARK